MAEDAITLDPEYARAYALTAATIGNEALLGVYENPQEALERAIEITQKSSGRIIMQEWFPGGRVLTFTLNPNPPTQQKLKRLTPAAIPHMNKGRKLKPVKLEATTLWDRRKFIKMAMTGLIGGTGIYALLNGYRKNNVLDIVAYPDPAIRKVSKPIDRIDDAVISMANAMIDTLRFKAPFEFFLHASLYKGLSAPQIGIQKRLIVCGLYGEVRAIVNPKILEKKGSYDSEEYCMSLPQHRRQTIKRSNYVKVGYRGLDNRENILYAKGPSAALLEHEIDHLNGVLYIDYI